MKNHLTENELIEYRFGLSSQEQQSISSEHLAGCAECRERLEKLIKKFAALDLLREDTHVPEELISEVLEQAGQPARVKVVPLYKSPWIGAVAAAVVACFVLLMSNLNTDKSTQRQFAKGPKSEIRIVSKESGAKGEVQADSPMRMLAQDTDAKMQMAAPTEPAHEEAATRIIAKETSDMIAPTKGPARDIAAVEAKIATASKSIPEQPPFAPASAIELVTLPRRDKVQLTIYNSADLTLVRERRNLTLKKGWNWLQFMWANTLIDPTSLSLEPLEQAGKIDIQQLVFPARLRELGRWLIRSEINGQVPFEITYFTSGLSWRAFYMGTLSQNEKTMKMQGYVRLGNNSGEDYENAQTRLIVGQVHILDEIAQLARRQYPYDRPGIIGYNEDAIKKDVGVTNGEYKAEMLGRRLDFVADLKAKEIKKEGLSEYFLYTIEGTETIPNEWGKRLLSFEAEDIAVKSLYKYDEERWGSQAIRFVKFANDEKHNLGQTPIPNGDVKIYSNADEQGYLSYVGGTEIKYIPVNEEVELDLGPARLVEIAPRLMDFKTENYIFDNRANVSGWDEIRVWKIEITNTRPMPIQIEITRGFGTTYWTLQSETTYEKYDATNARFKLEIEPRSKQTLEYTVRTYHGTREESLRQ
ncbi:MAG: hypothetical protein A2168_04305 [Planctomycetes bacterium RBG_13_50_24]|nr:MAG: hypothetical protein A2168_04305 [Planctomycetes bacterium RBG_13_50_24]